MKAGYWVPIAVLCTLALGGCSDDDSTSSEPDPFGNAGARSAPVGGSSGGGSTSFAGAGAGTTGMDAGAKAGPGDMKMDPMKAPMMPMPTCPAAMPPAGSPCKGRLTCTFGDLECRCRKEAWSCEMHDVMSEVDGGMMTP